jgi:hypothetical protein
MFETKVEELKSAADKFHPHPQISGKNGGQSRRVGRSDREHPRLLDGYKVEEVTELNLQRAGIPLLCGQRDTLLISAL